MSRIFEFNPTYWLVDKVSGTTLTNFLTSLKKTDKWLALFWNWSSYVSYNWQWLSLVNSFAWSCITKQKINIDEYLYWQSSAQLPVSDWYAVRYKSDNKLRIIAFVAWIWTTYYDTVNIVNDWNWHHIVINFRLWLQFAVDVYVDWVLQAVTLVVDLPNIKDLNITEPFYLWTNRQSIWLTIFFQWFIWETIWFNTNITKQEVVKLYKQFLQLQPLLEKKTNIFYPKQTELRETWLVAGYNMKPSPWNTLVDISGNGNNWTTVWAYPYKDWLVFNGVNARVICWTQARFQYNDKFSFSFVFEPSPLETDFQPLFSNLNSSITWFEIAYDWNTTKWIRINFRRTSTIGITTYSTNAITKKTTVTVKYNWNWLASWFSIYHGWVLQSLTTALNTLDTWTITYTDAFAIGNRQSDAVNRYFLWTIDDLRIYNRELSLQEIKNYHNKWARQIVFQEKFLYDKADWNTVVINNARHTWWNFKLVTETVWNSIIRKWQKYLETTSASPSIVYSSAFSWWTCEFSMYVTAWALTQFVIGFWWSQSYTFEIRDDWSAQALQIVKRLPATTILYRTANNYIARNTWYWFKVTWTTTWVFTFFIKWWAFWNNYVQTVTPWSTWTNPVTDTAFTKAIVVWYWSSTVIWSRFWPIVIKQWIEV